MELSVKGQLDTVAFERQIFRAINLAPQLEGFQLLVQFQRAQLRGLHFRRGETSQTHEKNKESGEIQNPLVFHCTLLRAEFLHSRKFTPFARQM